MSVISGLLPLEERRKKKAQHESGRIPWCSYQRFQQQEPLPLIVGLFEKPSKFSQCNFRYQRKPSRPECLLGKINQEKQAAPGISVHVGLLHRQAFIPEDAGFQCSCRTHSIPPATGKRGEGTAAVPALFVSKSHFFARIKGRFKHPLKVLFCAGMVLLRNSRY